MKNKPLSKKISPERVVLTSLSVDALDIILNLTAAIITGSIVMIAGTLQGTIDSLSKIFVYIGLKHSKKPADREHPFGYGKSLYISTFLSGIFMFAVTAVVTFYIGLQRFINPQEIKNIWLAWIILFVALISNFYSFCIGLKRILGERKIKKFIKAYKESAFLETKTTLILDLTGTLAILFGLIALLLHHFTGNWKFDGIGAMIIGITLGILTLFLLNNTRHLLIGKRAHPKIERKIKECILSVKNVKEVLDLKTMNLGLSNILVNVEVSVDEDLKTKQIEKLMDKIRAKVQREIKEVSHIQIELETK